MCETCDICSGSGDCGKCRGTGVLHTAPPHPCEGKAKGNRMSEKRLVVMDEEQARLLEGLWNGAAGPSEYDPILRLSDAFENGITEEEAQVLATHPGVRAAPIVAKLRSALSEPSDA